MRHALDAVAATLTDAGAIIARCPGRRLRFQHAQAVRAALMQRQGAATTNKMLSALRQTCASPGVLAI